MEQNGPNEREEQERTILGFKLPEGLLVLAIPALAYIYAFSHERGFTRYFNLPSNVIIIDTTSLLLFGLYVIIALPLILTLVNLSVNMHLLPYVSKIHSGRGLVGGSGLVGIALLIAGTYLQFQYSFIISAAGVTLLLFHLVALGGAIYDFADIHRLDRISDLLTLPDLGYERRLFTYYLLFLLSTLWIISLFVGRVQAQAQSQFLVTNTNPEMVVLRKYGDNLICATFDRTTKEVYPNFSIIDAKRPDLMLSLENVGPLEPVDPEAWTPATPTPIVTNTPEPTETVESTMTPTVAPTVSVTVGN